MNKNVRKWLRIVHRDLGFFFVGAAIIYGVSGILLNHDITAYFTEKHDVQIEKYLDKTSLAQYWEENESTLKLNKIMSNKNGFEVYVEGGIGHYNAQSGMLTVETYQKNALIDFVHRLHYNTVKGWKYFADFFALALIFFAISGLFLTRGKKGFAGSGKWYVIAGIAITFLVFLI